MSVKSVSFMDTKYEPPVQSKPKPLSLPSSASAAITITPVSASAATAAVTTTAASVFTLQSANQAVIDCRSFYDQFDPDQKRYTFVHCAFTEKMVVITVVYKQNINAKAENLLISIRPGVNNIGTQPAETYEKNEGWTRGFRNLADSCLPRIAFEYNMRSQPFKYTINGEKAASFD